MLGRNPHYTAARGVACLPGAWEAGEENLNILVLIDIYLPHIAVSKHELDISPRSSACGRAFKRRYVQFVNGDNDILEIRTHEHSCSSMTRRRIAQFFFYISQYFSVVTLFFPTGKLKVVKIMHICTYDQWPAGKML